MGGETGGGRKRERELVLAVAERRRTLIRYRVRDSAVSRPFRKLNHRPHTLSLSLSCSRSLSMFTIRRPTSPSPSPPLLRAFHALFKAIRVKPGKGDGEANRGRFRTSLRISKIGIEKEGGEGKIEPTRFFFFPSIERGRGTRVGDPTRHLTPRPKRESRPPPLPLLPFRRHAAGVVSSNFAEWTRKEKAGGEGGFLRIPIFTGNVNSLGTVLFSWREKTWARNTQRGRSLLGRAYYFGR